MKDFVKIGEVLVDIKGGGTPSKSSPAYWGGDIPWASVKDFRDGQFYLEETQDRISTAGLLNSASNLIPAGVPLICTRMVVGRSSITVKPTAINQDVKALYPDINKVLPDYLVRALHFLQHYLENIAVGSTVKGITLSQIKEAEIFCPKPVEQKAIAAVLDTVDEAIAAAQAMLAKQDNVKQGLLHDLLTRGVDENGNLRPSPEQAPELYQDTEIGAIPKEWGVVLSNEFCSGVADGTHDTPSPVERGVPLLTSKNLTKTNEINWEDFYYICKSDADQINRRSFVRRGDIIFGMIGTVGNPVIYDYDREVALKNVGIFRFDGNEINSRWMQCCLNSPLVWKQFNSFMDGSTQKFLSLGNLRNFYLPRCNYKEAKRITDRIWKFDESSKRAVSNLKKMRSVKSGLMQDLLTGRKRVTPSLMREIEETVRAA